MLNPAATRLAVWGDPIAHSRSPQLHAAAYRVLDREWTYERRRVEEGSFDGELRRLDASWRGLSLTMPLKGAARSAARSVDHRAQMTGAVNTLLLDAGTPAQGFNTDVGGIVRALGEEGVHALGDARIVGAGATATSALVALSEMGAVRVDVVARRPEAVEPLKTLGDALGVTVTPTSLSADRFRPVPVTIATLPGDTPLPESVAGALAQDGGLLFDVVYGHWPTSLSTAWEHARGPAVSGLGMLLHQALLQVRIFVTGEVGAALPGEETVLAAMREAMTSSVT